MSPPGTEIFDDLSEMLLDHNEEEFRLAFAPLHKNQTFDEADMKRLSIVR